jgi:HSP20 family protein
MEATVQQKTASIQNSSNNSWSRILDFNNKLIEVKKMSKEEKEKKAPVKAIAKAEVPVKLVKRVPAKHVPAKQVPAIHVLTTFDDLIDNFRRNFIESIAFPYEWVSLEPVVPVREATVDLVDEGKRFVVHAELPGVAKDKIDVALTKDGIEISAETDVQTEDKGKNFVVRERVYSHVYKQLAFPEAVIPEKAESTFRDGLLEVVIPKKTVALAPKKHKVAVK